MKHPKFHISIFVLAIAFSRQHWLQHSWASGSVVWHSVDLTNWWMTSLPSKKIQFIQGLQCSLCHSNRTGVEFSDTLFQTWSTIFLDVCLKNSIAIFPPSHCKKVSDKYLRKYCYLLYMKAKVYKYLFPHFIFNLHVNVKSQSRI